MKQVVSFDMLYRQWYTVEFTDTYGVLMFCFQFLCERAALLGYRPALPCGASPWSTWCRAGASDVSSGRWYSTSHLLL